MPPFIGGGHMIRTVGDTESTWTDLPLEVRGRHVADRRGDRARRRGRLDPADRDRADPRARARAGRRRAGAPGRGPGPRAARTGRRRGPRRAGVVRARRRPPARRRRDPGPRGRVRAHRPPLHPAADAPPRRQRHHAGVVRGPQHDRGHGPADRGTRRRLPASCSSSVGLASETHMDDLYRENILEHYKRPHNWSPPAPELERVDLRVPRSQPAVRRRAHRQAGGRRRRSDRARSASRATAARSRRRRRRWPRTRSRG